MFGFLRRKKKQPDEPLAVFDEAVRALERQAAGARRAAATLAVQRGALTRELAQHEERLVALRARRSDDERLQAVLTRDVEEAERLAESTRRALAQTETDAKLVLERSETLGARLAELKAERQQASAWLAGGQAVSAALSSRVEDLSQELRLDAARDEVERRRALDELNRDDQR